MSIFVSTNSFLPVLFVGGIACKHALPRLLCLSGRWFLRLTVTILRASNAPCLPPITLHNHCLRFPLRRLKYLGEMVNGGRSKPQEHERVFPFCVPLARYFSRHPPNGVLACGLHGLFPWLKEFFTG